MRSLEPIELFHICASDTQNSEAWSEFLRRYSVKLKYFISGTLRQLTGSSFACAPVLSGGIQESDLFQNAILRLVANECAAMKRFSGADEGDLLAYLAVICRSAVMDTLRQLNAAKRGKNRESTQYVEAASFSQPHRLDHDGFEREILIRELVSLTQNTIESNSGQTSNRDLLVFDLHFFHGLSFHQISQCKSIDLSKAGVEKLIKRLMARVQVLAREEKSNETAL